APFTTRVPHFPSSDPSSPPVYTLSLHDALPISRDGCRTARRVRGGQGYGSACSGREREARGPDCSPRSRIGRSEKQGVSLSCVRSEEHTSELQSRENIVCRLLLDKKNSSDRAIA